ncbi:outer membrane lipoprotein-sorting protein [Ectothiorhodospira marina]|uniref:outer membrane lipoprotein-sorting protein n=1 Tax=Ectothiorhodospira marina TaxID=1396821 RepID=UPI001FE0D36F|nr:outer membrane lipoprotein-sorting protein [Ectothiorhodospira marina]
MALGQDLAQRVYDRPEGSDLTTRGAMLLEEEGRTPRVREMVTYQLTREPGQLWSLIRFTAPADIVNTGLLTLDHPDGTSDQWVYLPAMDRTRRIPTARRGGRFVGSDLYFEDVQDRKPDQDTHRYLGEEEVLGVTTLKLESVPVDPGNSAYGRRVSWIHEPSLLPLRIDFYAQGQPDRPIKRMEIQRIDRIQGYWTVMDSTMTDLSSGHRTRIRVDEATYDRDLPESLFTSRALEDPALESRYRP